MPPRDPRIEALRHAVATVAYRGGKTLRGAPPDFAEFRVAAGSRTPLELARARQRPVRLGAPPGRGRARLAGFDTDLVVARERALLCDVGCLRPAAGGGRHARLRARAALPRAGGGRADARRSARHAAPARRRRRCAARTTSRPRSSPAASAPSRRRRAASSTETRWYEARRRARCEAKGASCVEPCSPSPVCPLAALAALGLARGRRRSPPRNPWASSAPASTCASSTSKSSSPTRDGNPVSGLDETTSSCASTAGRWRSATSTPASAV
jgi:hypothetical protein